MKIILKSKDTALNSKCNDHLAEIFFHRREEPSSVSSKQYITGQNIKAYDR